MLVRLVALIVLVCCHSFVVAYQYQNHYRSQYQRRPTQLEAAQGNNYSRYGTRKDKATLSFLNRDGGTSRSQLLASAGKNIRGFDKRESTLFRDIILFDGVCNFCNTWVNIIGRLDTNNRFLYIALQSPNGQELLQAIGKDPKDISSVVLLSASRSRPLQVKECYLKSDVPLKVLEKLGFPFFLAAKVGRLLPKPFRDDVYDVVAENRYNFMGKREECRLGDDLDE